MIDFFKDILKKNIVQFFVIPTEDIFISKFYHGSGATDHKVLFLVTDGISEKCIIKIMRSKEYNYILQNEVNSNKSFGGIEGISVPKTLFSGKFGDIFFCIEEFVFGDSISKRSAIEYLDRIFQFQLSIKKGQVITLQEVVNKFIPYSKIDSEFELFFKELVSYNPKTILNKSESHGDLTYKNILDSHDGLSIIDFEKANRRTIWGLDFCHYFIRCFEVQDIKNVNCMIDDPNFERFTGDELEYWKILCLIDYMFDYLEKRYRYKYDELIKSFK